MPRYIDADDAIYELKRAFSADDFGKIIRCISRTPTVDVPDRKDGKGRTMTAELAIRILTGDVLGTSEQTQEAVNMAVKALLSEVVEVVRCKDCKYKEGSVCDYSAVYVRPNGYCQWGERREDDQKRS